MKVGILSFNIADNAGAMLQMYSFYSFFVSENIQVEIIDYNFRDKLKFSTKLRNFLSLKCFYREKHKKFNTFRKRFSFSKKIEKGCIWNANNKYDLVFVGSDQVFNYKIVNYDVGYLCASQIHTKLGVYVYGASFGPYRPYTLIEKQIYKDNLQYFSAISLREKYDFFDSLYNKNYSIVCDPTILIGKDFWNDFLIKNSILIKEKFIFLYYATKETLDEAVKYANKYDLKIYYSSPYCEIPKDKKFVRVSDDPVSFVNYIYKSEYVFTTSYHCLIFALFYKKSVYLPVSDDERFSRMKYLIDKFNINQITKPELIGNLNLNYFTVFKTMEEEQKKSRKYIEDCLNGKYIKQD